MRKIKLVASVVLKVIKKLLTKGPFVKYRNKNIFQWISLAFTMPFKLGLKETVRRAKYQMLSINQYRGNNLYFPNGLISGVSKEEIKDWQRNHTKKVTVVICSYNDQAVLDPCIISIKDTTSPSRVNIIIVDDYCQPESRAFLKKYEDDPQIKVIYREENGGYTKAANTGMRAADKHSDVVFVNSDIVAHEGWLDALQYGAYAFGDSKKTGIVGAKLLYPDGRIQHGGAYRNTDNTDYFDHYFRFQDQNYGPANVPQYCLAVTGACFYVKRELLNKLGEFDEGYGFAHEDADYCLRAWEAGYRPLYFPAAVLTHYESVSRPKNKTISEKEKVSITHFNNKWKSWFDERDVKDKDGNTRIIYVLQSMGYSGGIRHVFENANNLVEDGFSVEIWGLDTDDCPWEVSEKLKIKTFKDYKKLTEALTNEKAIKVATWWETVYPVWLASIKNGIPVCFLQEFETWFYPNDPVTQSSVIASYKKEFHYLTIGSYQLQELGDIGLRGTYIPCGYDQNTYKTLPGVEREDNTLLALGRLFFQKNFEMTMKAWKKLEEKRPTMWLFGSDADMIAKSDKKIKSFGKTDNETANELYNRAGVFVQTSRHEGFCLPILEAMAAGCPVVCTDSHGNRDFCFDKKNCLIVEQDDADGLSKAIEKVLYDKKLSAKLSKAGIETAANYQWPVISKKVSRYYASIADGTMKR